MYGKQIDKFVVSVVLKN